MDLQPDFQRGDVWPKNKKVKLIDSILRDWKIPPVHVIVNSDSGLWQVLDGQQRLTAIRDFIDNQFKFDGFIHPLSEKLYDIDGLLFRELPEFWRRKLLSYEIRFIKLSEYLPEEPAELFFRLNQLASLTAAEQRNAFFGDTRNQVKILSELLNDAMNGREGLGFSNSRLAYDDVIARLLFYLKYGLANNFSNEKIVEIYRDEAGFKQDELDIARNAILTLQHAKGLRDKIAKFTKATLLSWLLFIARNNKIKHDYLFDSIVELETNRLKKPKDWQSIKITLTEIYNESVSYRVNEQTSVISRDMVIYWFYSESDPTFKSQAHDNLNLVTGLAGDYEGNIFYPQMLEWVSDEIG